VTQPFVDAHLHVVDPRFPVHANQGFTPGAYPAGQYLAEAGPLLAGAGMRLTGAVVVAGSFQGTGQDHLTTAVADLAAVLGAGRVAAVAQLPPDTGDGEILTLDGLGVRALRANLVRREAADTASGGLPGLLALAGRARALAGWHLELYVRAQELPPLLRDLPAGLDPRALVVDHLVLTAAGLDALIGLAGEGARVKATGFSRTDLDVPAALRAVHRRSPGALVAGTDLPGTRAPRRFGPADLAVLTSTFDGCDLRRVLSRNAEALYRLAPPTA